MRESRLVRRGGKYYYRARVPADLLLHYKPKREFRFSLRTGDRDIAKRRVLDESIRMLTEFEQVRRAGLTHVPRVALGSMPEDKLRRVNIQNSIDLIEMKDIDDHFITRVCLTYLRSHLDDDAARRADPENGGETYVELHAENRDEELTLLRSMLGSGNVALVRPMLASFLALLGYRITGEPPGYRLLLMRFLEAKIRVSEALKERDVGKPIDIDAMAPSEKTFLGDSGKPNVPMHMIVTAWDRARTRRSKTVVEYRSVATDFDTYLTKLFKVRDVMHVSKAHVQGYRDQLFADGQKFRTVRKKIGILKSLFATAVSDDIIRSNPCERVRVEAPHVEAKARVPFTQADLHAIFSSDVYKSGVRLNGCGIEAPFWIPLVAAFSGMRLEEICQLKVRDIRRDEELGWYFSVNDEDGKTIKNHSSRRNVPVHSELRRIGLLDFVKAAGKPGAWLFHDLSEDKHGRRGSTFSKQWNRYTRKLLKMKPNDHTRSFHSFRHTFKENCRRFEMLEEVHDAITGHAHGASEGRKYGHELYPLPPMFREIVKYRVPGLDLSHVKWRPRVRTTGARRKTPRSSSGVRAARRGEAAATLRGAGKG